MRIVYVPAIGSGRLRRTGGGGGECPTLFMAAPIPARMLLAACDLIRVLKQHCILRNFFIRDVRGFRKELSAFSDGVLCAGGITKTLLATAMNAF